MLDEFRKARPKYDVIMQGPPKTGDFYHGVDIAPEVVEIVDPIAEFPPNPDVDIIPMPIDPKPLIPDIQVLDPMPAPPLGFFPCGVPGIGDGSVVKYDPLVFNGVFPCINFDPDTTNPTDRGCPAYSHELYPQVCPHACTSGWQESIFSSVLSEGNVYREANSLPPMLFDRWLMLAMQSHAMYLAKNWSQLYNAGQPMYVKYNGLIAAHYEPEPPTATFGVTISARVMATGRGTPNVAEGIGFGGDTPIQGFCSQKSDYVSPSNPGHFWALD